MGRERGMLISATFADDEGVGRRVQYEDGTRGKTRRGEGRGEDNGVQSWIIGG